MSIKAAIKRHVRAGRLFPLEMTYLSDPVSRGLFLTPEVQQLLEGPWTAAQCKPRAARLRADLEAFVKEDRIVMCLVPFEAGHAFMGRLDRPSDEVWDIRSREGMRPGLRIFGRFAAPDHFIAFSWRPRSKPWNGREPLGDRLDPQWEKEKKACIQEWNKLFPKHDPVRGNEIQDYVTKNALIV